jgi:ATP-binding cassette subfamily B protein
MVAEFHGKKYSLQNLRSKSFITRAGVSMLGISESLIFLDSVPE